MLRWIERKVLWPQRFKRVLVSGRRTIEIESSQGEVGIRLDPFQHKSTQWHLLKSEKCLLPEHGNPMKSQL
jgi:hypothetical protein